MSKTTFLQRFDKTQKFFDNVYHHHKATYKGMAEYFQNYAEIQKQYSSMLLKHAQSFNSSIVDFAKEQPYIQQGVKEVGGNIEKISQLHYNFGERLKQIAQYCRGEYVQSKKQKQKFMKLMIQKNQQEYEKVKQSRDRARLNEKQKQICKSLYESLDRYIQDELLRTQKLKQQVVIYFSLYKKIAEKKIDLSTAYNLKMAQFEVNVSVPKMEQIQTILVDQHNSYGEQKIYKKNREINQQIQVHRSSLRESIIHREKMLKLEDGLSKMTKIVQKYKSVPQELNYPIQEDYLIGIFDRRVLPQYRQFSREFKSEVIKEFALAWISSYFNTTDSNDQNMSLLTVVKTNMRVKQIKLNRTQSVKEFVMKYLEKCEQTAKKTIYFLVQISQIYEGTLRIVQLQNSLRQKQIPKFSNYDHLIHWKIYLVLVDCLLQSLIVARQGFSILYDEYFDIFKLIHTFAKETFNLDSAVVMSLFLRKLQRVLQVTQSADPQKIQQIFEQKINFDNEMNYSQELKLQIGHKIINFLTDQLSTFYKCKISFSNLVKLSLMVQKTLPKNYFTAMQHMHSCIKTSGFNFFVESDQEKRLTQGSWRGDQRLKNLTEMLEQLEFEQIHKNYLEPMARQLSIFLGVGYQVISEKMKKQFSTPIFQIIQCNLQILCEQQGYDLQGYALRLGVCLSLLDSQQPQDISFYKMYFNVLSHYLTKTQKQYDQLLEHARKTQLWIVEDNSQATQNCIDFCSMLYKPFEFLLTALKKLQTQKKQTQFTKKFSDFIKLKLNKALRAQIEKYVTFLSESLSKFSSKQPELNLKYKRLPAPIVVANDQLAKQRYSYRQVSRRLFNLLFLKDQLDEIVCDFIQPEIYKQINSSIFNLDLLMKVASSHPTHRDILQNIYEIASLISETYNKLIFKAADITVFHFMRRIFLNLYLQEEKGFFASDKDYKLSQFTFVKCQQELEQLFLTIGRNLPAETVDEFSKYFSISFCKAYRCEVLDSNKFKIPIKQQSILTYLQSDLNFFCSTLKQKLMLANYVKQYIEQPCKRVFRDIQKSSQKLMQSFSEATMKNMNDQAKYILLILNLKRDEKAQEFVQKYKKVLK